MCSIKAPQLKLNYSLPTAKAIPLELEGQLDPSKYVLCYWA